MSEKNISLAVEGQLLLQKHHHLASSIDRDMGVEMDEKSDVSSRMNSRHSPDSKFIKSKESSDPLFSPLLRKKPAPSSSLTKYLHEDNKKFRSVEKKPSQSKISLKSNKQPKISDQFRMVMVGSPMGETNEELLDDTSEHQMSDITQFKLKVLADESYLSCSN